MIYGGEITGVARRSRLFSHFVVEELMIATNEAVAEVLTDAGYPVMYRSHPQPPEAKADELRHVLGSFGISVPKELNHASLQQIIDDVRGMQVESVLNYAVLRTMAQAIYTFDDSSHWGLASDCYCHFTSPIRRYPDLVIHRLVKQFLARGALPESVKTKSLATFGDLAADLSIAERTAEKAERDMLRHLQSRFAAEYIGEITDGIVVSVVSFGLFVELQEPFCEGLIHISQLGPDRWTHNPERASLVGRRTGKEFRLGDELRVQLARVDLTNDRIDLNLVTNVKKRRMLNARR